MPGRKLLVSGLLLVAAVVFRPGAQAATPLTAQARMRGADVMIACTNSTPGKWYQAQWTASLESPNWQPVAIAAQRATNLTMALVLSNGIAEPQRFYRVQEMASPPVGRNLAVAASPQTSYVSSWETLSAIPNYAHLNRGGSSAVWFRDQ